MKTFSSKDIEILQENNMAAEDSLSPYACRNCHAQMEYKGKHDIDLTRTQYAVDVDKIIHSPFFNRGNDKTQVFSFYRNDDITRRALHVQLVSRIARVIGKALRLNLDLIEAIAIGHDIGHTPFGHKGEYFLNELYNSSSGRFFNHNVHSVRVLQRLSKCNLTLQTLDGILCHCGEKAFEKYEPAKLSDFNTFNQTVEECYTQENRIHALRPGTLEGCVVRISDMIAYVGKDRQDARKAVLSTKPNFDDSILGKSNSDIIKNVIIDIISNSLDKPYISMSRDVFEALTNIATDNHKQIYQCDEVTEQYFSVIKPMMTILYDRFLDDYVNDKYDSLIYQHYINGVGFYPRHREKNYILKEKTPPYEMVADFIASMTDDYFIDAFRHLYPKHELNAKIEYVEYFDNRYFKSDK